MIALGDKYGDRIMNWDTKLNGTFVPWAWVSKALACIDAGNLSGARACLMHPVKSGLIGGPDVSGVVAPTGKLVGWEIKAGRDEQRDTQVNCQRALERHGAIYLVVENVEQGLADTERAISESK